MSKVPSLTRSDSMQSLLSQAPQIDKDLTTMSPPEIIDLGKTIMHDLIKSAAKKKNNPLKLRFESVFDIFEELEKRASASYKDLDTLTSNVIELEAKLTSHVQIEHELRAHLAALNQQIKDRIDRLPTLSEVAELINNSSAPNSSFQEDNTQATSAANTEPGTSQRTTSAPRNRERSPSPGIDRIHKRTIIIKGAGEKLASKEIQQTLTKYKACTGVTVSRITHKRFHIEVVCSTREGAVILKRDMQRDKILNRTLSFTEKSAPAEKLRIFNAPHTVDAEDITNNILRTYKAYRDEINILKCQRSRQSDDSKDWIMVLPTELGRALVKDGLTLGFRHCRVRPHTSIRRCLRCQAFDHLTGKCSNPNYCPICGERHEPRDCEKAPRCINCLHSNRHRGTNYPTDHSASDFSCHSYKERYSEERQRLDYIFRYSLPHQPPQEQNFHNSEEYPHSNSQMFWGGHWPGPPNQLFGHWPQFQRNDYYEN